jgi:class 3 adenylate cyclase
MRSSSEHLKSRRISSEIEYGFQRIYYETSALLPAITVTTSFGAGAVTEYLGDGALVLFSVDETDRAESVRSAYRVANNCIHDMRTLINEQLRIRYNLPEIALGAGLALSKALVTLVGTGDNLQPKAIGECIWEATKLSGGMNHVHVSEQLMHLWPSSKGGKLQFHLGDFRGVKGYRVQQA